MEPEEVKEEISKAQAAPQTNEGLQEIHEAYQEIQSSTRAVKEVTLTLTLNLNPKP